MMKCRPTGAPDGDPEALIQIVDGFLSSAECRRMLRETIYGQWVRSAVETGRLVTLENGGRNSESLLLPHYTRWLSGCLRRIERRLSAQFHIQPSRLEPWQMVQYRRGDFYDYHIDSGAWSKHASGERARTILIVIEQPLCGGATHFRALARYIRPLAGRLIVWQNLLSTGRANHAMIHAGRKVWRGRKTILTTWERQRTYCG